MKHSAVLLQLVCFCAALLVGIMLPALPPGHSSRVTALVPGEGLSLPQRSLYTESLAQVQGWTRTLDPAILTGSQLPLFSGVTLGDLFVYAFDGSTWTVVPFQFDEVDSAGAYVVSEDGLLDSNDELVFMAADLGNQATPSEWLDDADSRSYSRYEVQVTNPLNTAEVGWVYVYRSATLAPTFSPYVTWDSANNRIVASTYIIGYVPTIHIGLDSLELNGSGVDVLDRSKMRVAGSCYIYGGWHAFTSTEEDDQVLEQFQPPTIGGPVRAGGGTLDSASWSYASLFENTTQFDATYKDPQCEDMEYTSFRLSDDWLNPSESGMAPMTYYDSNTPGGVTVDGTPDSVTTTPAAGWWEVSGARGSVVQVADIDAEAGVEITTYYKDDQTSDSSDTGDKLSFGDAGSLLNSPTGIVSLSFANYVLGANQGNVGATYQQQHANPLQTAVTPHDYQRPLAPTLNGISNPGGDGAYLVDWSDVSGATGYELQEDDNAAFSSATVRYNGANSQFDVTGQTAGVWYYRVRASNSYGASPWSNTESVGVIPAAPVLADISNADGNGDYLVDWNNVTGATSYQLEEDDNSTFSSPTVRYTGSDSQYQVSGQGTGDWYYRVRASNIGGNSAWSNTKSVHVTFPAPVLAAISNADGNGDYLVDWNDVAGATSYRLEEDDNSAFSSATVRYTGADSQYQVTGQAGGTWYYRVRASDASVNSAWSNTESVVVIPAAPALAAISNADGNGDYLVDWNDVTGATSYQLEEDDNSSFSSPTVRYTGSDSQYQVSGQGTGLWYYRVRASNTAGDSAWSNTESVGVAPAAPVLDPISNTDGNGDYLVDWNDVSGATSYQLEEDDNSAFSSATVRYTGAGSQYQVSGQAAGDWYYRVRASNAGANSAWSNTEVAGVIPAAPVLADISNADGNGDYLVDWNDVSGATSYQLEEDDNSAFSSPTVRYTGAGSQYSVSGQAAGLWYYRVRAGNTGGNSAWSNTKSVGVVPAAPVLADISNADGDGAYVVDWNDVTSATSYQLEEDDNSSFTSPTVRYSGADSQYQVTGQGGGDWYYRVRAVGAGGNSAWSNTESVRVTFPAPVLAPIDNPDGDGSYLVDWNDVTGATSYQLEEDDNSAFSSPTVRYTGAGSQYQVSGQGTGLWYYRVRTTSTQGNSLWSNTESVGVVPAAPVLAAINNSDGDGYYLVDWNDVTSATSYRLEEDDNSSFSSPTVSYTGAESQYQVSAQGIGLWYYRVRASNAQGDSLWSNVESSGVVPPAPVLAPIDNADGNGAYLVNWSDVTGATGYQLEEDDNSEFSSPTVRYSGTSSQYSVSGQGTGLWYYRARAVGAGGNSAWSNTESVGVVPAAPVLADISNPDGDGAYVVDWNDVTGATGYVLEEDDNSAFSSPTTRYSGSNSQYSVSGQAAGLWYYRVRAANAGGNSAWSNTESVGVVPPAPVLAPIDNPDGDGAYLVNWSDVTGATGYELQEDDNSAFSSPTVRYSGTSSQYSVSGQATGLWYYRARAVGAGGNSAWSNTEPVGVVPSAPVLADIDNPDGDGSYLVDWNDVTGATSYQLEEDDNSSFTSPTVRYAGAGSQYSVSGQATGLWFYRVRASNAQGNSLWSNTESVGVVPAAPVLADISNPGGDGAYLVDWSDVTGATGYELQEDDNSTFSSPTVRYNGASSQYQVSAQAAGLWYYRVRASNAGGNSAWSNTESVGVVPDAPVLATISNPDGDGAYLVDWNDVAGATGYRLEEDDNSEFSSPTVRYTGAGSQYQVSGQAAGLWFYRVLASNAGGNSAWSNTESVGVIPAAPVLAAISNADGNGDYLVDWNDVAGATSYRLEEDDNSSFSSPTVRYTGAGSQYSVSGQGAGLWYYRVRASNAAGNSAWSNTGSVGVVPEAPVLADIGNLDGNGEYLVDWNDVTGATSYRLEEDDNSAFTSPTMRYTGGSSQYQVSAQAAGLWYYRVRASNAGGNGAWSNTESVGVIPAPPVLAPIDNPEGDGSYLVDWSSVAGATSYVLEEDDNPAFSSPTARYSGSNSQYSVSGQGTGLWYYRVRAAGAGGTSAWSNTESVGVVPAAPVLSAISNADGDGNYLVDWSSVTGATSYMLVEDDNSAFTSPTVRYNGADSQYEMTGQAEGTWYYRVRAGNAGGDGPWSNVQSAIVEPIELEAPFLLPIDNADGNGDYLVNWSDVAGSAGYTLEEDDNPYFASPAVRYSGANSQYQVTGQAGGDWYYRVRAANAGGDGPWSNSESASVLPAAPVLAAISNSDGDGEYLVNWGDVAGATGYQLEEDDNSAFSSPTVRYNGAKSEYTVSGQGTGRWYYRVRASNAAGDSPWSNTQAVDVAPASPFLDAIDNLDGDGEYMVDWSDVAGATGYQLQEDDNSDFGSPIVRYAGASSQYLVSGQGTGRWYYRVRASSAAGDGPWSNMEAVGVLPQAPVLLPIGNADGDGAYLVDWNSVTGAMSYELQEDDNLAFSSPSVRYTGANSQYQVSGQGTGLWYYQVRASNAGGYSAWSNTQPVGVFPVAPALLTISNPDGNGEYLVDWSNVEGAVSYQLEEDDNSQFNSPTVRYTGAESQFQVSAQGTGLWYYRVRASNAGGDGLWSNTGTARVLPPAPTLEPIANPDGDGEYLVDWGDVTGATSYQLEEDDNSEFSSPTLRYTGATSQYQVSGKGTGLWFYRVRAGNAAGKSLWSNIQAVGVVTAAPILSPIDNSDGNGYYLVNWSDVTGAMGYQLEEDDNPDFSSPAVRYNGVISQYQITSQAGGTWYHRVRASNAAGYGAWSNTESASVIPAAPVLQAILNLDGDGEYLVDWSSATGATSYRLEEDDNLGFTSPTVRYTGGDSQYQVSAQGTGLWYYRVRAGNAGGDSPWSNIQVVVVVPAAPVLNPIDNPEGDGEYLVDWDEVAEATSYVLEEDDNSDFTSPIVRYTGAGSQYQAYGQGTGLWYYRVRAIGAAGDGLWSNTEMVGVVPAVPELLAISDPDGDRSYLVKWMDVSGATGYLLEEDDNPDFSSAISRYKGPATQIEVVGQPVGTWYYRVRAYDIAGSGLWSATQSVSLGYKVFLPLLLRGSAGGQ